MSHYYGMVVLPPLRPDASIKRLIAEVMAPHREGYNEATEEYTGWWDWWQIGGRWTGVLDDYDPGMDPANVETCYVCHGTGTRTDMVVANGCNGCAGTGTKEKWPTDWAPHPGDIARLGTVRERLVERPPFRLVGPELSACVETYNQDGTHYDDEPYETAKFQRHPQEVVDALASLSDDCIVVVVDYHC